MSLRAKERDAMKITATVDGLDTLRRIDPAPLVARLQAELDAELQAMATQQPPAAATEDARRRAALERALQRMR